MGGLPAGTGSVSGAVISQIWRTVTSEKESEEPFWSPDENYPYFCAVRHTTWRKLVWRKTACIAENEQKCHSRWKLHALAQIKNIRTSSLVQNFIEATDFQGQEIHKHSPARALCATWKAKSLVGTRSIQGGPRVYLLNKINHSRAHRNQTWHSGNKTGVAVKFVTKTRLSREQELSSRAKDKLSTSNRES